MLDMIKTGKYGLLAHQNLLGTTSNNISNVNTEGYVRQQTNYYTSVIDWGIGESYTRRMYDQYVQRELYRDRGTVGYYDAYTSGMSSVDSMLSDDSMSISSSLNSYFSALQEAVQNPTSTATRRELLSQLEIMVDRYSTLNTNITQQLNDVNAKVDDTVTTINDLVYGIYNTTKQINQMSDEQSDMALQLKDKRDQLVYELSELVDINTTTNEKGELSVYMGNGQLLVSGDTYATLHARRDEFDPTRRSVTVSFNTESDYEINIKYDNWGGKLGGLLQSTDEIRQSMRQLGQLAVAFADAMNVQNKSGITLENKSGSDLITIPAVKGVPDTESAAAGFAMTLTFNEGEGSDITANDYKVSFKGGQMLVFMVEDGKEIDISDCMQQSTAPDGTLQVKLEGHGVTLSFNQNAATLTAQESVFYVQPTLNAAYDIETNITKPEDFAFASAVRGNTSSANQGNALIEFVHMDQTGDDMGVTINADGDPVFTVNAPTTVVIDDDGNYQIRDAAGNTLGVAPASCNGQNIFEHTDWVDPALDALEGYPGYEFSITGTTVVNDTFSIEINRDGFADNSNGVVMGTLQQENLVYSSGPNKVSFTEGYANILGDIGSAVMSAQTDLEAATVKMEQTEEMFSSCAGVNLDEEAANLLRFQQCYSACAKIISTSQTTFDSLISAF